MSAVRTADTVTRLEALRADLALIEGIAITAGELPALMHPRLRRPLVGALDRMRAVLAAAVDEDLSPENPAFWAAIARARGPHKRDALKVMGREALVLIFAANDMAAGVILAPETRARMLEAALTIRGAAGLV